MSTEREFAERMGVFFETLGGTRTMGLIYGWLIVCEPVHQSITELAGALGVSKASISTVVRQLELAQVVERVPVPGSRQHHYRVRSGGWEQILRSRVARLGPGLAAAEYALANVRSSQPDRFERLNEMRDFFTFLEQEFPDVLTSTWGEYRKRAQNRRAAGIDA